jgi:2-methylcitrate dehydratase PrpD
VLVVASRHVEFVRELAWGDVPAPVRDRVRALIADLTAVCVAGRAAPAATLAADHASAVHPGEGATALLDGRRLNAVGAAWANGVLANVLDMDDGHRMTKGHPGAIVIPAALAVGENASEEELLAAIVVGYEVAIRAGVAQHARAAEYHASGSWGAVGAAAAAARLLGLDATATARALSLAEYHGPIAPIMRSVAEPAMTKDACGWGAATGVSSALLAARGFTALQAEYLATDASDLGSAWRVQELYVKAYPCCRWSQPAIRAALEAGAGTAGVARVVVRTFAAAAALSSARPATTEEAQYNLVWPVAAAIAHGRFGVAEVLGPWDDPEVAAVAELVEVVVDDALTAEFPARRLTAVEIVRADGTVASAGPLEARGEPDDPLWGDVVAGKVGALVDPGRDLPGLPELLRWALDGMLARA